MKIGKLTLLILSVLNINIMALPLSAQTDENAKAWGSTVDGVQISLRLTSAKTEPLHLPVIELAIRNLGAAPRKITLGSYCGPILPGSKTSEVVLIITDQQGRSKTLKDIPGPPLQAGCGGGIGIFAVDVVPGATTLVPLDLDCYYLSDVRFDYAWAGGGRYLLRAEVGGLKSNEVRVQFAEDVPSRRCFSSGLVVPCANK